MVLLGRPEKAVKLGTAGKYAQSCWMAVGRCLKGLQPNERFKYFIIKRLKANSDLYLLSSNLKIKSDVVVVICVESIASEARKCNNVLLCYVYADVRAIQKHKHNGFPLRFQVQFSFDACCSS